MTTDFTLQTNALDYLSAFDKAFKATKGSSPEEIRLQSIIDETIRQVKSYHKMTNRFLITLEKFYQSTSFMVGITNLKLSDEAYQAWRAYDHFHYDNVKPELHLFGNMIGPI